MVITNSSDFTNMNCVAYHTNFLSTVETEQKVREEEDKQKELEKKKAEEAANVSQRPTNKATCIIIQFVRLSVY